MPVSFALVGSLAMLAAFAVERAPAECTPPAIHHASTVDAVQTYFKTRGRTVVTFMGYSGAGYEDNASMLARATAVLDRLDPRTTLVNIGATIDGIGAVYALAKQKGFETTGIVSSQARVGKSTLAPCAGTVFFVEDAAWGGLLKGTTTLSPTSMAIVRVSDHVVAIGGGEVARDEFDGAKRSGKKTEFFAADMNHGVARARAAKNGSPAPTDFRGALGVAMAEQRAR